MFTRAAQGFCPLEKQTALTRLDKVRELVISYAGLTLQEPEMFPQPSGYIELATFLISFVISTHLDGLLDLQNSLHLFFPCPPSLLPSYQHPSNLPTLSHHLTSRNLSRISLVASNPTTKSTIFWALSSKLSSFMNPYFGPKDSEVEIPAGGASLVASSFWFRSKVLPS